MAAVSSVLNGPSGTIRRCNILVAGVPGVGKTSFSSRLAERLETAFPTSGGADGPEWEHIDVGKLIAAENLHDGVDREYMERLAMLSGQPPSDSDVVYILNEDKVVDALEELVWGTSAAPHAGHKIVDYHTVDFFPERWFHVVVLLRCVESAVLFDRLERRGYSLPKVQENVQAEIMDVVANDVRESYPEDITLELDSVVPDDADKNVEIVVAAVGKVIGREPLPDPDA